MASGNSVSSIPVNAMERIFRDNFKAGLQGNCGIVLHKLECTVCDINIQHRLVTSRNEHVILGVLLCNSCSHRTRLNVNEYAETNYKNWCHWCARKITSYNGTKINLVSCSTCTRKFCQTCIRKHNSSRERRSDAWMCFTCNPNQHWYKLRALCSETLRYTEEMKKDLDNRRKRIASSSSAARRTSRISTPTNRFLSPTVTTNISTSSSNVSAIVTVSTSPMMSTNVSVSLHHSTSPNLLNTSFLASGYDNTSFLSSGYDNTFRMPSESMNQSFNASKVDDGITCVICLSEESRLACIPCGHLCLCETCSPQFEAKFHHCPICRSVYIKTLKIYYGRN